MAIFCPMEIVTFILITAFEDHHFTLLHNGIKNTQ